MRKVLLLSIVIGILGALASFMVLVVDTNISHGNILSVLFLPFHIAIVLLVVFFKKPTALELIMRIISFVPAYVLLNISDLNEIVFDIVNNYSAAFLGVPVTIIINSFVIGITLIIASIVRMAFYANEKAITKINVNE